jgi:hypothetical protein
MVASLEHVHSIQADPRKKTVWNAVQKTTINIKVLYYTNDVHTYSFIRCPSDLVGFTARVIKIKRL